MRRLIETPPWLPSSLSPFAATSPTEVSVETWKMIKTEILAESGFTCTSWDATQVAAVYRGRLTRTMKASNTSNDDDDEISNNSITKVFNNLRAKLDNHPQLASKVQLFMVDDNEWRPSRGGGWIDSEESSPPPVIIALPKEVVPEQESERSLSTKSLI